MTYKSTFDGAASVVRHCRGWHRVVWATPNVVSPVGSAIGEGVPYAELGGQRWEVEIAEAAAASPGAMFDGSYFWRTQAEAENALAMIKAALAGAPHG